jgi:hypothetical protein
MIATARPHDGARSPTFAGIGTKVEEMARRHASFESLAPPGLEVPIPELSRRRNVPLPRPTR